MCTVTYIPTESGYILTSNRDEKKTRGIAIAPKQYGEIFYPKDTDKGGSWIVSKKNGDSVCLLNGGFAKHVPQNNYSKSRGLLLLEIAMADSMISYIDSLNLSTIEPFTLVVIEKNNAYEIRWDGVEIYKIILEKKPYIWSSVTLYSNAIIVKRQQWFVQWLRNSKEFVQNNSIAFHKTAGDGNIHNNVLMNRENEVYTVSITSIEKKEKEVVLYYENVLEQNLRMLEYTIIE